MAASGVTSICCSFITIVSVLTVCTIMHGGHRIYSSSITTSWRTVAICICCMIFYLLTSTTIIIGCSTYSAYSSKCWFSWTTRTRASSRTTKSTWLTVAFSTIISWASAILISILIYPWTPCRTARCCIITIAILRATLYFDNLTCADKSSLRVARSTATSNLPSYTTCSTRANWARPWATNLRSTRTCCCYIAAIFICHVITTCTTPKTNSRINIATLHTICNPITI